jgi:hypothetical protein
MKFDTWFKQQHGKRPSKKSAVALRDEMELSKRLAYKAEVLYLTCLQWDRMRTSALYAWQVKDSDK